MLVAIIGAFASLLLCLVGFGLALFVATKRYQKYGPDGVKTHRPLIEEVKYLGPVGTKVKSGGFTGALIGGMLFGDAGAIVGGMTPKGSRTIYRFAVRYDNGKVKVEDVLEGSARHDELMCHVKWEDL